MEALHTVTVIFYKEQHLECIHEVRAFPEDNTGRVDIPYWYKADKCIVAVCDGKVGRIQESH